MNSFHEAAKLKFYRLNAGNYSLSVVKTWLKVRSAHDYLNCGPIEFMNLVEHIKDAACSSVQALYGIDLAKDEIAVNQTKQEFEGDYTIVDFNYTREALSRVLNVSREPEAIPLDTLDVPYWGRNFMKWNDEPGRRQEEVIDALKKAADLAEQLGQKCK